MIKVIEKHFCDRCEKEITEHPTVPSVSLKGIYYTVHNGLSYVSDYKEDTILCPKCADEFLKWFYHQ